MGKCSVTPLVGAGIQSGTYTGDGAAERVVYLGKTPSVVIVFGTRGFLNGSNQTMGGVAMPGRPAGSNAGKSCVEICDLGFKVFFSNLADHQQYSNNNKQVYPYVALFD